MTVYRRELYDYCGMHKLALFCKADSALDEILSRVISLEGCKN